MLSFAELPKAHQRGIKEDFDAWMKHADALYLRFFHRTETSPFYYHEISCVSFLAAAAALAGYVPLTEYALTKRQSADDCSETNGRADLWVATSRREYSLEFKRAFVVATQKNLSSVMAAAVQSTACIIQGEFDFAVAGLIARVDDPSLEKTYRDFANSQDVDFWYRLGPDGTGGAYVFFRVVDRWVRS